MIYRYLPEELIPGNMDDMDFEEFFRICAMAQIARDMYREDITVGVNKGYVLAHPDSSEI